MINIWIVLLLIFIHWLADFVCQTDWQAKNKSSNNKALLSHVTIYTAIWAIPMVLLTNHHTAALFVTITFVSHFITDYFTSRLNTKLWANGKVHNFFVSIGFDQVLHYAQLFLTYYFLTK